MALRHTITFVSFEWVFFCIFCRQSLDFHLNRISLFNGIMVHGKCNWHLIIFDLSIKTDLKMLFSYYFIFDLCFILSDDAYQSIFAPGCR